MPLTIQDRSVHLPFSRCTPYPLVTLTSEDLRGLEYCSFLVIAVLNDNRITDLGPLAGLPLLYDLSLDSNPIGDLGPLAGLTNLYILTIGNSQVTEISPPLAGLTKLGVLDLSDNQISDLSPLAGLTGLWELLPPTNSARDIEGKPAPGFSVLRILNLSDLIG